MAKRRKSAKFKSTVVLELLRGESAEELSRKFVDNYNRQWLIYRLGSKSPLEYREEYERKVA